jgi:hypothetical protein
MYYSKCDSSRAASIAYRPFLHQIIEPAADASRKPQSVFFAKLPKTHAKNTEPTRTSGSRLLTESICAIIFHGNDASFLEVYENSAAD